MMKKKHPLVDKFVRFQIGIKNNLILVRNYFFLKINANSEGAIFHNVLYYRQLSNVRLPSQFLSQHLF